MGYVDEQFKRASSAVHWMRKALDGNRFETDATEGLEDLWRTSKNHYQAAWRRRAKLEEASSEMEWNPNRATSKVEVRLMGEFFVLIRTVLEKYAQFIEAAQGDGEFGMPDEDAFGVSFEDVR